MQAAPRSRTERFQVYGFLANEAALKVWELPVGYFWYPPESWAEGEIVVTKLAPELGGLPPGRYDLGLFVATREDVLLPREAPEGAVVPARGEAPARVSLGEVVWPDAVRVLPDAEALSRVDAHLDEVDAHADAGECGKAEAEWRKARAYRPMDEPWLEASFPRVERAMGRCHVARARAADTDAERIRALIRARDWDHHNRDQRALAAPLAEALHAEGLRARAEGDWEAAYRAFSDAVALDARRSWSRRRAEEARAHRLGLSE
jgi:hypothetical protein